MAKKKKSHIIMSVKKGICHLYKMRCLNYWVQEVRELKRGDFYGNIQFWQYSVLYSPRRPMKGHGPFWNDYRMRQGPQKQLHHLPESLVLCFLLLILHSVSRHCEWCAQFYKSPDPDASRYMAYGCSLIVSSRQEVHKLREKGIKHKLSSKVC